MAVEADHDPSLDLLGSVTESERVRENGKADIVEGFGEVLAG